MSQFSKKLALVCALGGLSLSLTGCHGSKGLPEFTVPEEFDTSRNYEITFWAKNDTNKTQTEIYKKAIADFEALYPNITVNLNLYTDYGKNLQRCHYQYFHQYDTQCLHHLPRSHCHLPHRTEYRSSSG